MDNIHEIITMQQLMNKDEITEDKDDNKKEKKKSKFTDLFWIGYGINFDPIQNCLCNHELNSQIQSLNFHTLNGHIFKSQLMSNKKTDDNNISKSRVEFHCDKSNGELKIPMNYVHNIEIISNAFVIASYINNDTYVVNIYAHDLSNTSIRNIIATEYNLNILQKDAYSQWIKNIPNKLLKIRNIYGCTQSIMWLYNYRIKLDKTIMPMHLLFKIK